MKRSWHLVYGLAAGLLVAGSAGVWAADEGASSAQPAPGGNIIGYQPITSAALEGAMNGTVQPASPAYPAAHLPAGQAAMPNAAPPAPGAAGPSQLPTVYLTGVVGDGLYTLGRDDVIRIDVRAQPEFTGDFMIGFDGRIQYNYLGDIPVAGMTKYEVEQVIEQLLQKYIRQPTVNVTILAYNSKVIYVIGEVHHPGKFIMRGDVIKLREAILAAGLPTMTAALGRTHVIKPDLNNPLVRKINLKRILYKGKLKDDVDLTPGEIVVVPSTVLSSVNRFLSQLLSPITRAAAFGSLAAL